MSVMLPKSSKNAVVVIPGDGAQRRRPGTQQTPMVRSSLGRCLLGPGSRAAAQRLAGMTAHRVQCKMPDPIENQK